MSTQTRTQMAPSFIATLNSTINSCRDILRREGITGMDSMKHLTLYSLSRAIDSDECERLGIPREFSWDHLTELAKSETRQECYDLLYNKDGNDLISHLDTLFGTRNFNFKLKNPDNHIAIVKQFATLDFKNLSGSVDILGTIYENHLGSGSSKSAMRDLGQFFTDRRVCSYMTSLCDPKWFPDGRAESVLDPTMGTGGFLTAYVNYLQELGAKVDWNKMQMDIAGYDIDEFVMSIGRINMYLSTGILFERITHRDSLQNDVGEGHQRMKFKIILANMPFGVKGLKFADCCKRVKELKCDGTKSEPLFLNLMMAALDDGGRCAVVVPDGVLVNNSKQHNSTRKYLLEHFELKRVIKMKGQFFSNTGIQPSILFFENNGKKTDCIEFWEVEQDSTGTVVESMIAAVEYSNLDDACSLDVRRYQVDTPYDSHTNSTQFVTLEECCEYKNGKTLSADEKIEHGEYDVMGGGIEYIGKTKHYNREGETISISKSGASAGFVAFHTKRYWAGDCLTITSKDIHVMRTKFIYYYLKINNRLLMNRTSGSTIPHCKWDDIKDIKIPLPPLPIQQEIVSALDNIYNNATTAKAAIDFVKAQMAAIMKSVNQRGYEKRKLSDVFEVKGGKAINKENLTGTKYRYYGCNGVNGHVDEYLFDGEYIICAQDGSIGSVYLVNERFYPSNHTHILKTRNTNQLTNSFGTYYLKYCVDWKPLITSIIPKVTQGKLLEIDICVPPLPIQQQVLSILNEMDAEHKALEQMVAKAEERAKCILSNYLNLET